MQIENVLELFAKLSGLSEEELYQARFLCEMAMEHIRSRCTGNEEEEGGRQSFAAAALAYYRFLLWTLTEQGGDSIKVGEVTVKNVRERLEYAQVLYQDALAGLEGLKDDGFVFERMEA